MEGLAFLTGTLFERGLTTCTVCCVQVEEMDGAKFAKFCRDTKIVDKKFTTTDVDLTYAKAKAKVRECRKIQPS